jgi:hypothetical protein
MSWRVFFFSHFFVVLCGANLVSIACINASNGAMLTPAPTVFGGADGCTETLLDGNKSPVTEVDRAFAVAGSNSKQAKMTLRIF